MVKCKYGEITEEQLSSYKAKLHSSVHWLLIYAEKNDNDIILPYFTRVQETFLSLNEVLMYPESILEIINKLEIAKLEYMKKEYNHRLYRSCILDVHDLIDKF